MKSRNSLTVSPSGPLRGVLDVPGDKSISHRAVLFGSIAHGTTEMTHLLEAEDVLRTVEAMRALGVKIRKMENGKWKMEGKGIEGLRSPSKVLYCGNSGTTLRLLTGLLAGSSVTATLTGDASLNRRPMGRVIEPLRAMGAKIEERRSRRGRWIRISGRPPLKGGRFRLPVASAQVKSALLLAGLASGVSVSVSEPSQSRDHTERMLRAFGAEIKARKIIIPGDFSSAAFFLVAGLINRHPKTTVSLRNVGLNPTRTGALQILRRMGAKIRISRRRTVCGEPVGDLEVGPSELHGVGVSGKIIPRLIDEIPILSVAAACAEGRTVIRGAGELRVKETDRIRAIAAEFSKFGVRVKELPDGLEIFGVGAPLHGATVRSYGDHRMAMSLAVLGTVAEGKTVIRGTDCIGTSFPNFVSLLKKAGVKVR